LGAAVLCVQLVAEEIQLKDGSKITGKLTGVNGDAFQVKTAYGEIQVPRSEVVTINFPENLPAKADGAPPEQVDEALEGLQYVNRTAGFSGHGTGGVGARARTEESTGDCGCFEVSR
jgi:hypothetical protein